MADGKSVTWTRFSRRLTPSLIVFATALVPRPHAAGPAEVKAKSLALSLNSSEILALARSLASGASANDNYSSTVRLALDNAGPDDDDKRLTAFEENRSFVYVKVSTSWPASRLETGRPPGPYRLVRRLIILKPSTFVIDDEVFSLGPRAPVEWRLYSQNAPRIAGQIARIVEGDRELSCETPRPHKVTYELAQGSNGEPSLYFVKIVPQGNPTATRFLHVLHASEGPARPEVKSDLIEQGARWKLTIAAQNRIFRLSLPPPSEGAGDIAIAAVDGKSLLDNRPLPSGILPHGPEGARLLELWDADYQGPRPPAWDIGRPADELQRVVSGGTVRACRAVDLCCGSGTDAIYLARRGFEVTAVDIAPTALSQAEQKARQAGVSVRWVLADVLAPPDLDPFEFVYDRGCYHVVRDQNLAAYVDTLRRLSRPGARFLLLAARRDEHAAGDRSQGVTEEELRYDFLPLFDLEWLREIRLESNQPGLSLPGWSALWRRKAGP